MWCVLGDDKIIKFKIPLTCTSEWGLNKIYAGVHWTKRKKQAEYVHMLTQQALRKAKICKGIYKEPVSITMRFNDRLDIDNHGYIVKLIIDGLKGYLIADDTKQYVKRVTSEVYEGKDIEVIIEVYRQ